MNVNLVYVHIGNVLPDGFIDNIYQTLLTNSHITIYILIDDLLIHNVKNKINELNDVYLKQHLCHFIYIKNSIIEEYLNKDDTYINYTQTLSRFNLTFRENFWISTTKRFFYINALMDLFLLENIFHIENDVLLYADLHNILTSNITFKLEKPIFMYVTDSPNRVVPSILFIQNHIIINKLIKYITYRLNNSSVFLNDMELLAEWTHLTENDIFFDKHILNSNYSKSQGNYIYDAAAIGQYLGGVDLRNLTNLPDKNTNEYLLVKYNNPSKGFINETSTFKPNLYNFYRKLHVFDNVKVPIYIPMCINHTQKYSNCIANLHIHNKQLYQFSSVLDINYNDIISGERIMAYCDYIILTKDILAFHKGINYFTTPDKLLLINDFNNVNYTTLNDILNEKQHDGSIKKIFIYTHLLDSLISIDFFNKIDKKLKYNLYFHNSDHSVNNKHSHLLDYEWINKIYCQNIDLDHTLLNIDKAHLLPIGLANIMWPHGNVIDFYNIITQTYLYQKTKNIYVNINSSTLNYRQLLLNKLNDFNWFISKAKPYNDYLFELSQHYFCLCVRGNGLDTHRFWESLYLGVIPVIINTSDTKCQNFINKLNELDIPFYEIKDISFFEYNSPDFFNKQLYQKFINRIQNSIQNIHSLKLSHYIF